MQNILDILISIGLLNILNFNINYTINIREDIVARYFIIWYSVVFSQKMTIHVGITIERYGGLATNVIGVKEGLADFVKRQNTSYNRRDFAIVFSVSILIWILCNRRYLRVRIYLTSSSSRDQAEAHSD